MKNYYQEKNIMIIKFGGLGDFFLSFQPMYSIKAFHKKDKLILLTEPNYFNLAKKSKLFDKIITIKRSLFYFIDRFNIRKKVQVKKIHRVYDLQTSKRSASYYKLFESFNCEWSGISEGCSHFHKNENRDNLHTEKRFIDQLRYAGIKKIVKPDTKWLISHQKVGYNFNKPYALIVPGGSAKRKYKRIPTDVYELIINKLLRKKITPLLIGTNAEIDVCQNLKKQYPNVINLCNKLNIFELASVAKKSQIIIGNDTGPMHLFAILRCKLIVLFTEYSEPALCAPRGKKVKIINYNSKDFTIKNIEKTLNGC